MHKKLQALLSTSLAVSMLPLHVFAADNTAPVYDGEKAQFTLETGEPFVITRQELSEWFTDKDDDPLNYWIRVGNTRYLEVQDRCIFVPEGRKRVVLTVKANDGKADSEEVPIELLIPNAVTGQEAAEQVAEFVIYTGISATSQTTLMTTDDFDPYVMDYNLSKRLDDTKTNLWFRVRNEANDPITLIRENGTKVPITMEVDPEDPEASIAVAVNDLLTAGKNKFQIRFGDDIEPYTFMLDVVPTLKALECKSLSYWDKDFKSTAMNYSLQISKDAQTVEFAAECTSEDCSITYNGSPNPVVDVTNCDTVEIKVSRDGVSNDYTVKLEKLETPSLTVTTEPADATVRILDHENNEIKANENGNYIGFFKKYEYKYSVSHSGYVSQKGVISVDDGQLRIVLEKVKGDQPEEVSTEWKNFRGSDNNMAIVDTALPTKEVAALWTLEKAKSYSEAPSVQIIVDDALIVMQGTTLYKLDLDSGEVLQSAEMAEKPNWGYTPPTYGAGMIFCPLANGTLQAFNATTLESLWIYQDSIGGQSISPITYEDGYIYTGFWTKEEGAANYVCIDVTDEDTSKTHESKIAQWLHKQKGGFYWAGSVVVGDAVIVGTDDGEKEGTVGTSKLYSFDRMTGEVITKLELTKAGDQRSSIAYDAESKRIYFTTKGGYLCRASVNPESGELSELKQSNLGSNIQSTSTPVVYGNRVYFGMGGGAGNGGYFAVADADTLKILIKKQMKGYPQGSALLSTAYEDSGYLYLYMTYNSPPGGISMLKVKKDCKTVDDVKLTEIYEASGYSEYCISSLICSDDGVIYYKNDSGTVFAVGTLSYQSVVEKIDKIGTVTVDSEAAILAAREAYETLSTEDKNKVSNYSKLTEAEAALEKLLNVAVKEVEKLISEIGTVSLHSAEKITAARKAYDKLSVEEKKKVSNYSILTAAEKQYSTLVLKAVAEVEELIDAIGTVTKDSQSKIIAARTAYEQLSEDLKEMVENYDVLVEAEEAFKKLPAGGTAATTTTAATQTVTTYTVAGGGSGPSKSELLQLQEDLENVDSGISYEHALEFLKVFYSLDEEHRLALEDSEGLAILKTVVADYIHIDENTGIYVEELPWNIRVVATTENTERVLNDLEKRLTSAKMLSLWDIYLEDVLTGERYIPSENLTLYIPMKLLSGYNTADTLSIIHYNEVAEIEVLSTQYEDAYIHCSVVEFSYYGVADFSAEETIAEVEAEEEQTGDSSWILWLALAAACIAALAVLLYFRFFSKEEDEDEFKEIG